MDMIVCIKQVPGTSKVEVDETTGVLKRAGIESKMNPYDLYALEAALKIKEQTGGQINVLSMGPPQAVSVIKESYMLGADAGVLLCDPKFAGADVLATAYTLAQGIKKLGRYDLIICGKQTTDGDTAQVGPEIAEYLGIPHVANVKQIKKIGQHSVIVEMDLPDSVEIAEITFPCLIAVEKGINTPRLPSYKKKMATLNKEIHIYRLSDLADQNELHYGLQGSPTQVEKIFPPAVNSAKELWNGSGPELADRLFNKLIELKFI